MAASSPFPAPPSDLVGREREQHRLSMLLNSLVAGQGHLVLIGGEAGIGKSALVHVLAAEAAGRGVNVLTGHCYDLSVTPPYGPWREALRRLPPGEDFPAVPSALTDDGEPEPGGEAALFRTVLELLAAISAVRPTVIVLEDLHWADQASLDLLRYLARQLSDLPVLIVTTYRADEVTRRHPLAQLLPTLVRESPNERFELRRLDETALRALVGSRYQLPDEAEARLVDYLQRVAEGNPFYAQELLRSLEEERVLATQNAVWTLGNLERVRVPALLQHVVEGRLARLGDEVREQLAVAAVIGQRVPLDIWQVAGAFPADGILHTVERAVEAHLLEAGDNDADVAFSHALVREVLHESILPPRRRVWHRRVAEVLSETAGADPDAVAYHFMQSGDARAADWLVRAGERAFRAYAWLTTRDRFAAAVAIMENDPSRTEERGWLLYRLGRLLRMSDFRQAVTYFEEAERVGSAVGDPSLAAFALADRGQVLFLLNEIERGMAALSAGVDAIEALPTGYAHPNPAVGDWVADALPARETRPSASITSSTTAPLTARRGLLALQLGICGRFNEAQTVGQTYLDQAATIHHPDALALGGMGDAAMGVAMSEAVLGHPAASRAAWRQAQAAFRAIDHHLIFGLMFGLELKQVVLPYETTDLGARRTLIAEQIAALVRGGGAFGNAENTSYWHLQPELAVLLLEAAWVEAERTARVALVIGHPHFVQEALFGLASLARWRGEPAEAWGHLRAGLPQGPTAAPGSHHFWNVTTIQRLAVDLALDTGDLSTATAWLEAHDHWLAWSGAVRGRAEGRLLWARFHRVAGDLPRAEQTVNDAIAEASDPRQPLVLLATHRLLGEIMTETRRFPEARHHLAISLELVDACAAPFERALTLMALAELHAADSESEKAARLLDDIRSIAGPLGAAPLLARADALSSRLAETSSQIDAPAQLTTREMEVLHLVAAGRSNSEIADELFISPRTVTTHVTHIFAKLDAENRTEAVALARHIGLI